MGCLRWGCVALTLVILLAVGCENKQHSHKEQSSARTAQDAKVAVVAQGTADGREHSDSAPAGPTVVETAAPPKADTEILVPLGESADSHAQTLGDIRKQLAELVQEAVKARRACWRLSSMRPSP